MNKIEFVVRVNYKSEDGKENSFTCDVANILDEITVCERPTFLLRALIDASKEVSNTFLKKREITPLVRYIIIDKEDFNPPLCAS